MARVLTNGGNEKFESNVDFKSFLNRQADSYRWITFESKACEYKPLENNPIMIPVTKQELGMSNISDEQIAYSMESSKLVLSYPLFEESRMETYPVGDTAYRGLFERLGANCPSLVSLKDTNARHEVAPNDKASILNMLAKYSKGDTLCLVGDEQILALHSDDYVKIPFTEIIDKTENTIVNSFEYVKFLNGTVCHEVSTASWLIEDYDLKHKAIETFEDIMDVSNHNIVLKVVTSDVGVSGVNIYPLLIKDNIIIPIGTPVKMEHKGDASVDKFLENLEMCFASFKDIKDRLDEVAKLKIHHPSGCLYNIGKKIQLPEKELREAAEEFAEEFFTCSGKDVFVKLFEILSYHIMAKDDMSELKKVQMLEMVTRSCFFNMSRFDMPALS